MTLPPDMTLRLAREWLRESTADGTAVECPCCKQNVKVYRRPVSAASAFALIALWRAAGFQYGHLPTILNRKQADEAKMRYWGLIEEAPLEREDGGRAGYWRVTEAGEAFLHGITRVPQYAVIYDGRLLRLEGDYVSIRDCLGTKFDYDVLMSQVIDPPPDGMLL